MYTWNQSIKAWSCYRVGKHVSEINAFKVFSKFVHTLEHICSHCITNGGSEYLHAHIQIIQIYSFNFMQSICGQKGEPFLLCKRFSRLRVFKFRAVYTK